MTNLHSAFRDQTRLSKINAFTRMIKTACLVRFDLGIHFRSRDRRVGRRHFKQRVSESQKCAV